jgi:hypothetical protein
LRSFDTGTSGDGLIAAARDWPEYNDDRGATGGDRPVTRTPGPYWASCCYQGASGA